MSKDSKPREEPKIKLDDIGKDAKNPYKKQWPKDDAVDVRSEHDENDEDSDSDETIRGILDHPSYLELEKKLSEMEAKANDYWNKELRTQAELENVRRRAERDVTKAHKYALEKFVADLLPIVDSLDRALQSDVGDNDLAKKIHEGIELTMNMYLKTLEKHGVNQVDPLGDQFNPELHQAIATQPSEEYQTNTVIEVLQKGFILNDRLIRPALVVVAS
jgi:molecular chaperone GrpE